MSSSTIAGFMHRLTDEHTAILRQHTSDETEFEKLVSVCEQVSAQRVAPYEQLIAITTALSKAEGVQAMLDVLAEVALEHGAEYASIFYIDVDDAGKPDSMFVAARAGNLQLGAPVGNRLKLHHNSLTREWIKHSTRTLFINNIMRDERLDDQTRKLYRGGDIRASVALPLHKDGDWIGMVNFNWTEPREFTESERIIYGNLPVLVSPFIENLRVRTQLALPRDGDTSASLHTLAADLKQRTRTLNDMLAAIPYHYIMVGRDGRILYANPTTLAAMGATADQVIGRQWNPFDQLSEESKALVQSYMARVFNTGEPVHFEHAFYSVNGTRDLDIMMVPIHNEAGDVMAIVFSGQDITERKAAEAKARDLAVERERKWLLTQLVRGAGHEFRNPLAVIRTKLYLLERTTDEDRRRQHLDQLSDQADIILELVEALHTLAKLEDPDNYAFNAVAVAGLIARLRWKYESALVEKQHTLNIDAGDHDIVVTGNEELLSQALGEVMTNAIKYTPQGGVIDICVSVADGVTRIAVTDNGPGIDPEQHTAIFAYFTWIELPDIPRGHGLGLSMAQKICALHGGDITLASTPGEGATFTIHLPIKSNN